MEKIKMEFNNRQMEILDKFINYSGVTIFKVNTKTIIESDKESLHILLEKLSNSLIQSGLDVNTDEPNEYGLEIEEIIDIIGHNLFT